MIPLNKAKYQPRHELSEPKDPGITESLARAPLQQREMLVDEICEALMAEMGTTRAKKEVLKARSAA